MLDARKARLAVLLTIAAIGSWWLTRQAAVPTPSAAAQPRHEPDYIIDNLIGNAMDALGSRKYLLTAKQLTHYPDDDTTHFVEPVLVQYQPGGATATTRADVGVMPSGGAEILMTGNVHLTRSADGRSRGGEITTDRLRVELDR